MLDDMELARGIYQAEAFAAAVFAESLRLQPGACADIASSKITKGTIYNVQNPDWYLAIGDYKAWGQGSVRLDTDGFYTMDYTFKIADRYNWDKGKSTRIAGYRITDAFMSEFHGRGLAKEFDVLGSVQRTLRWKKGELMLNSTTWEP